MVSLTFVLASSGVQLGKGQRSIEFLHPVCRSCLRTRPRGGRTDSSHLVDLEETRQTERKPLSSSAVEVIHFEVHEVPGMPRLALKSWLWLSNSWPQIRETCENKERVLRDKGNKKIEMCPKKMFTRGSRSCMIILRKYPIVPGSLKTSVQKTSV